MNDVPRPNTPGDDGQAPLMNTLNTWWAQLSDQEGWLGRRAHDVAMAPTYGWRLMATWIKVTAIALAATLALFLSWAATSTAIGWAQAAHSAAEPTGLLATLTQPVHGYLTAHTVGLPLSAATAYGAWQLFGIVSFALSWLFRAAGARLTWTGWGAATTVMVWYGTTGPGRTVAAGLTVLAWTAASTLALRGLSLTPVTHVHNESPPAPDVHAEIHLPAQKTATLAPFDPAKHQPPLN